MDAEHERVVVGLFGSERQAEAAVESLHRIGVTDADVEIGTPEPGRYRVEYHESAQFWTAIRNGMAIGAVIGAVVAMGIMRFAVPGQSVPGLIELGVPMGAAWGLFLGGLVAMAVKAITTVSHAEGEPRYVVPPNSSDVLVVVHAGDRVGLAHETMERRHARYFLTDVPVVHHGPPHLAATA